MSFDEKYKLVTNVHNYFILVSLLVVQGPVLRGIAYMVGHAGINGDTVLVQKLGCEINAVVPLQSPGR